MRLYRFRSDLNPEHTLDILRNQRLFCSSWRELNDPMEGTYSTLKVDDPQKHVQARQAIYDAKVQLRVCSFSTTYKKHTMWAYYANGFHGLAIELDLDDDRLHPIDYASGTRIQSWVSGTDPYQIARQILTKKHSDWKAEQEVRLLHDQIYFDLPQGCITGLILGSRIRSDFEEAVREAAVGLVVRKLVLRSGNLWAEG